MRNDVNRKWVLNARPKGAALEPDTFRWDEEPIPEVGEGEFLVRNLLISFDPAQRGWINDVQSYVPPVQIGETMRAGAIGQVIESRNSNFQVGDLVNGTFGWQEFAVSTGEGIMAARKLPPGADPEAALSVLGGTGMTAYFGMKEVGKPVAGDTVVVSGAAGATGSVAGQVARLLGASKVIGIAGGPEKCRWLTDEAKFDAAIDYKSEDVGARLDALAPDGVNVYFDNVGGPILDQCLARIAQGAQVVTVPRRDLLRLRCRARVGPRELFSARDPLGADGGLPPLQLSAAVPRSHEGHAGLDRRRRAEMARRRRPGPRERAQDPGRAVHRREFRQAAPEGGGPIGGLGSDPMPSRRRHDHALLAIILSDSRQASG